jgi:hypothetical protein
VREEEPARGVEGLYGVACSHDPPSPLAALLGEP